MTGLLEFFSEEFSLWFMSKRRNTGSRMTNSLSCKELWNVKNERMILGFRITGLFTLFALLDKPGLLGGSGYETKRDMQ
jgi:hypothetical protein